MDVEQRRSGLVVPKAKLKRSLGRTEIRGKENRERAAAALLQLWEAMDLSNRAPLADSPLWESHYRLYRFLGESLLGPDCPEREVLT